MNKTKLAAGNTRKSNGRHRNGANGTRRRGSNRKNRRPTRSTANLRRGNGELRIADLTKGEQTELALRQSEERYRTLFDLGPVAIYSIDSSGVIGNFNRRAAELWGREPALGDTDQRFCGSFKMFRPDGSFMPHEQCPMADVVSGKITAAHDAEVVIERPDGSRVTVLVNIRPLKNDRGEVIGAINCFYDITERKRAEEAVRASEEQFRAVFNQTISGIAQTDLTGQFVLVNDRYCQITGRSRAELLNLRMQDITHPEDLAANVKKFRALAKGTGENFVVEKRYLRPDGSNVWVHNDVSAIRDREENVRHIVAVVTDITQRKKADAELKRSKELLEQLVEGRTRALRVANDELQNEISRRKGLEGQILEISDREQERLGQELHDGLCQQLTAIGFLVRATALRLKDHRVVQTEDLDKIAQLINSSVADARNIARDLHKEEIDAAEFSIALRALVERKIWKTPCRLELKTEVSIEDDKVASQLYRILREAIINANKHARATQIALEVRRVRNELVFCVTDNGVGLSRKPKAGQGLGFHIMQYRAQSIGARLEFESPKKGGSRVACHLPLL
jgi:PAS domain S-box-containing protein